jgi:tetratricopeptide (TPR) repeat protein
MDFTFFNPRSQKESDFLLNFVARTTTLSFFLQQLRLTAPNQAARHLLVVAPRGYGKTSLLRRISIAVRTEAEFNAQFIALTFREEQHNVISLDVFWRNCLVALLEAREDEGASPAENASLEALCKQHAVRHLLKRDEQDGEPAWQAFHAHCQHLGRRAVLLIDNLDSLLAGLTDQHQWGLRRVLQREDGPCLMAAASRYPESTHDTKAAFFDFFRIQTLDRLSDSEVMLCLRTLATHRGDSGKKVIDLINTDPGRISALNTLSGGNPRTLAVLYSVLEAHMSEDILSQLNSMLDTFTGWYQARTEELPLQTRAVFDALALNWNPMTAAALGAATGLDTPTVSSHLARMEKLGFAESVSLSSKRKGRNGYQVSERFFNIWYLMRHGPRSTQRAVKFLTTFLQSCFSNNELRDMASKALNGENSQPAYALALATSLRPSRMRDQLLKMLQSTRASGSGESDYAKIAKQLSLATKVKQAHAAKKTAEVKLDFLTKLSDGLTLHTVGKYQEAETAYRQAIEINPRDARAYFALGLLLQNAPDRLEDAEAAYRRAFVLDPKYAAPYYWLGKLLNDLGRFEEAEAAYIKTIALDQKYLYPYVNLGNVLMDKLGRPREALASFRQGLVIEPKSAVLHANCAYALALHELDLDVASYHTKQALANIEDLSVAGRLLLSALPQTQEPFETQCLHIWTQIDLALASDDKTIWTNHQDDLQRLLWYVIVQGQGDAFHKKMEDADYEVRFAPLFHAFSAALDGPDHLLQINPETRQPAQRIYDGLAWQLKLYPSAQTAQVLVKSSP